MLLLKLTRVSRGYQHKVPDVIAFCMIALPPFALEGYERTICLIKMTIVLRRTPLSADVCQTFRGANVMITL
jgi:hypothetical protein